MAELIDGKRISQEIKDELKEKVAELKGQGISVCLSHSGRGQSGFYGLRRE